MFDERSSIPLFLVGVLASCSSEPTDPRDASSLRDAPFVDADLDAGHAPDAVGQDAGVSGDTGASSLDASAPDRDAGSEPDASSPPPNHYGGPCELSSDCLGDSTYCDRTTGGYCIQSNGPDFVAEGQPCANDPASVGFVDSMGVRFCVAACGADSDCRPGYYCLTGFGESGTVSACAPIRDCDTRGCNTGTSTVSYYCEDSAGANNRFCWVDSCLDNPCANDPNAMGSCISVEDTIECECVPDTFWNTESLVCQAFVCRANDLGTLGTTSIILGNESNCQGSNAYDPSRAGCTGWDEPGRESVYLLGVNDGVAVRVTLDPNPTFDASLYALETCNDLAGETCVAGSDLQNPEQILFANETGSLKSYYIVADTFAPRSCGSYTLTLEPANLMCPARDLGLFSGAELTRAGEDPCADGTTIYNPGLAGCTSNHETGKELVYRLSSPPGERADFVADPTSGRDLALYVISTCRDFAGATCTSSLAVDASGNGGTETLRIENSSGASVVYYVVVDTFGTFGPDTCTPFDLTVSPAP